MTSRSSPVTSGGSMDERRTRSTGVSSRMSERRPARPTSRPRASPDAYRPRLIPVSTTSCASRAQASRTAASTRSAGSDRPAPRAFQTML